MNVTYRCGLVSGALLMVLSCGGRSSSDFTIYDDGFGGTSNGSGGNAGRGGQGQGQGGTAVAGYGGAVYTGGAYGKGGTPPYTGGAYGYAGSSYAGAYGYGGAYAVGGAYGKGGAYAVGGAYGKGGSYGTGGYAGDPDGWGRACMGFCQPLSRICPDQNVGQCTSDCVGQISGNPSYCRDFAAGVLSCMTAAISGFMNCDQALAYASQVCAEEIGKLECDSPPNCRGYGSASAGYCDMTYDCGAGRIYGIQCSGDPYYQSSVCSCMLNGAYTGQTVYGSGYDPCYTAFSSCSF